MAGYRHDVDRILRKDVILGEDNRIVGSVVIAYAARGTDSPSRPVVIKSTQGPPAGERHLVKKTCLIVLSKVMKILMVLETSGPGGAETTVLNLSQALADRGHDCVVAVPATGWVSETSEARNLPWGQYTPHRRASRMEAVRGLRRLVQEHYIDIIHAHMFDASVYAALAAAQSRVPMISTIHGFADIKGSRVAVWAKSIILRMFANDTVFVSQTLKEHVTGAYPLIRPKARMIANGIPLGSFVSDSNERRFTQDSGIVFGALGNIRKPKGYDILLEAAAQVCERVPNTKVLIAGQPDSAGLYERLLAQQSELGLDRCVEFLGHVSDVPGFFLRLDCLVSSSLTEGMPLSLMEAMAQGLAIVATRCGGVPELIGDEVTGLLCEPGNAEDLASAMIRMATQPSLRDRVGKAAAERATAEFSLDTMCDRYEQLYEQALARHNAS